MHEKSRRPHWIPDLLDFFVRRRVLRQRIPLLASFKLTYRCNLACLACPFHRRAAREGSSIGWTDAVRALDELKRRRVRIVAFEGGEPFVWRDGAHDLRQIVEYAGKLFLRTAVTTNGTFPLDVPADALWVSLDGLKETHDKLRSGSFDRVWSNLEAAGQTRQRRVMVHFTLNRLNRRELEPLAAKLAELPGVRGLSVQVFYPYNQGESPLALSPSERRETLETVIRLKKKYPIINSSRCLRGMIGNDWRCHDDILINVDPDGGIRQGCYVKGRGEIHCRECGFTPVAEASAALDLRPGALLAGWRAYLR